ncbi:hypothetical protein AHAS_Ahas15G0138500 [Arachis hypogaea]
MFFDAAFKKLQFLKICGRGLTDGGVKHIKEMTSLTQLNLSQNCNLTDKTLKLLSGMTALRSLNVSNTGGYQWKCYRFFFKSKSFENLGVVYFELCHWKISKSHSHLLATIDIV